ncbi:MAG: OB-fold nucleic acid binding domain-containing protein, partial [Planctomycetes bacterium]|nr:OB-fold nucleic acid binding domain-containing protein [Planctomycetota bacterium]
MEETNEQKTESTHEPKVSERSDRLKKLEELRELGINPYPAKAESTHSLAYILANFETLNTEQKNITVLGRLRSLRAHGNLTFTSLQEGKDFIQVVVSKKDVGPDSYKLFTKLIDVGDFVQVTGTCFVTHKGEKSILIKEWKILTKALRPLPDKFHGLTDEEEKLRRRYLDIMLNPEVREMVEKRAKFWQAIREFLSERGFIEVETPVLEVTTGGADARPFITHHNALDLDVYLRISMGELWQKKLMVAGMGKTFEIGRQFRNEGMDAEHLQDYTQMEFYWSYANYEDGMKLVEEMYKYVALKTFGTLQFTIKGFEVDLGKTWERYDYRETVLKYTGVDILNTDEEAIKKKLEELHIDYERKGFNITRAIDNLW